MTDPVADMLTRVRNACYGGPPAGGHAGVQAQGRDRAAAPRQPLHRRTSRCWMTGAHGLLRLYLKYHNDAPVIRELRRVSAPGLRRYVKAREIPRVKNGLGMAILSHAAGAHDRPRSAHRPSGRRAARGGLVGGAMSRIGKRPVPIPKGVTVTRRRAGAHGEGTQGRARAGPSIRTWRWRSKRPTSWSGGPRTRIGTRRCTASPAPWWPTWSTG